MGHPNKNKRKWDEASGGRQRQKRGNHRPSIDKTWRSLNETAEFIDATPWERDEMLEEATANMDRRRLV